MFSELRARGEGAFVPYLVLGDPDPGLSLDLARALIRGGADALELGFPFSDPVADGPVIQAAAARALARGVTVNDCWGMLGTLRQEFPSLPLGILVYANLVFQNDLKGFYRRAAGVGVDSVLVADVPVLEADPIREAASRADIASVLVAPPNAEEDLVRAIALLSQGYVYVVSRPGVTGADERLRTDSERLFQTLRVMGSAPPVIGFGVSNPEHVGLARGMGAAGVISGSAVVAHIPRFRGRRNELLQAITEFVRTMKEATRSQT